MSQHSLPTKGSLATEHLESRVDQAIPPLCEDLIQVVLGFSHDLEDPFNEICGTFSWKRSLMEFTKIVFGDLQVIGISKACL